MSYEEEDTCMSYEEEDTCMSYVEAKLGRLRNGPDGAPVRVVSKET